MSADAILWPLPPHGVLWAGGNDWEFEKSEQTFHSLLDAVTHTEKVAGGSMRWEIQAHGDVLVLKGYL